MPLGKGDRPMDVDRIDALSRKVFAVTSRRGLGRILAGFALAGPMSLLLDRAASDAKKKRKKKKKCKRGKKRCGRKCIPAAACCGGCGELGACVDGACVCLGGARPCRGTCIPVGNCCASDECGANAVCASGDCACLSGFKECVNACISIGACCGDELICGSDLDGGCTCETDAGGEKICRKDLPEASVAACAACPGGTRCVSASGSFFCYKLCGAT